MNPMILLNLYGRIATDAEVNDLDWETAAYWKAYASLPKGYFDNNTSVKANKVQFDDQVKALGGTVPQQLGGGGAGGGQPQVTVGAQFNRPEKALAWFDNPHGNKLVIQGKNISVENGTQNIGILTVEGNAGRKIGQGFTTLSNYYDQMKLKLPPIKVTDDGKDLEFAEINDPKKWIEWHSIEAIFQAFKVFITNSETNFSWAKWAQKVPDEAKGEGKFRIKAQEQMTS